LTPNLFRGFRKNVTRHGVDEAIKLLDIEHYTVSELLKILHSENLAECVDLVAGGHTYLAFTEEDLKDVKADFAAAKVAGVDVSNVEWVDKQEMEDVCLASYLSSP
jgi:hypothetical protein